MRELILLNYKKYLSILSIFSAFFLIEYNTPFHSDDFSYVQLGGVKAHLNHYLGWSGRVVADLFSTVILNIRIHFVISIIISFFSVAVCYLLVAIPNRIFNKEFDPLKFLFISAIYWVFSPNLGQTNFWVVGACNYLVTTFFVALTLYLFIRFKDYRSALTYVCGFLVSLFAGCSNENVCLALIVTMISIIVIYTVQKVSYNKKFAFIVLTGVVTGALVLLLAPGNYARLSNPVFAFWRELSLSQKIINHIQRSSYYIEFFNYLLLFYFLNCLIVFFTKKTEYLKRLLWSGLFFISSLFALAVMVGAPYLAPRAYSGIFFFLVLAFSVTADVTLYFEKYKKFYLTAQIIIFCSFIYSFALMFHSYCVTKDQELLRNNHINYVKMIEGCNAEVTIPGYYFIKLQKWRDRFDLYHSESQASWFNVKKVHKKDVDYDYSILLTARTIPHVNKTDLKNVKVYYQPRGILSTKSTILIESTSPIPENLKVGFMDTRSKELEEYTLRSPVKLMDRYYVGLTRKFPTIGCVMIMN